MPYDAEVLLQIEQVTKRLAYDAELLNTTPKICDALLKKLDVRLAPDMIKSYSAGWEGASTRGMDILDRLKQAKESYGNVCDLITSLHAGRGSPLASSVSLDAALRRVRDGGVAVGSKADEVVVLRMVNEALNASEFDKVRSALDGSSDTMKRIGAADAAALQVIIIQKNVIDMCREANENAMDGMESRLASYIGVLQTVEILDTSFVSEVSRLRALVTLATGGFEKEEYHQLQSQKDEFMMDKTGVFFKAFTLLPLGSRISISAAKAVDKMLKDKSCEMALATLKASLSSLAAPCLSQLIQQGEFVIPNQQQWAEAAALYAQVATAASDCLRAEHAASLQEVADTFQGLQSVISMAVLNRAEKLLKDFREQLTTAVSIETSAASADESVKALQSSLEQVTGVLRMAKEMGYQETLPKEAADSLTAALDAKLTTIEKVGALLPWLMQYVCNGTADVAAESANTRVKPTRARRV